MTVIEVKRDVERPQLAQALEYAGWARSVSLDDMANLYERGEQAFFEDWKEFTDSPTPRVINRSPRLILVAHDIHPRTRDALRFLADSGLPVSVVLVSVYEDDEQRRFIEIEGESELTGGAGAGSAGVGGTKRSYMFQGHPVRVLDLIEAKLVNADQAIEFTRFGKTTAGVITADGSVKVGDATFPTPSGAGKATVGHAVDGWKCWKLSAPDHRSLFDLRAELLRNVASSQELDQ